MCVCVLCVCVLFEFFICFLLFCFIFLVGREEISLKKKICNLNQFIIPSISINNTLILLPRKLERVSGELITSFQTQGSLNTVFNSVFIGNKRPFLVAHLSLSESET